MPVSRSRTASSLAWLRPASAQRAARRHVAREVLGGEATGLSRAGHDVPVELLQRDVTLPYRYHADLVPVFRKIYENADANWEAYEACEELVDLEENFQLWRFRHLKTVERTIGVKLGTGGSSGVDFLRKAWT